MNMLGSPIAWLAASLAVYAVVTNAAWCIVESAPERMPSLTVRRAAAWLYLAGVPILALAARIPASPAQFGLAWPSRPLPAIGIAIAIGVATAIVLCAAPAARPLAATLPRRPIRPRTDVILALLADALALALHAAFVRSVVLASGVGLALGPTGGAPAMVATLVVLAAEALLNPWLRHAIASNGPPPTGIVRGAARHAVDAAAFALSGSLVASLTARLAAGAYWLLTPETAPADRIPGATRTDGEPHDEAAARSRAAELSIEPTVV